MSFPINAHVLSITGDTAAYSINDVVGTKQTVTDPVGPQQKWGRIRGVTLRSASLQTGIPFALYCFRADPSASTITNNAAFVMHAADQPYCFKVIALSEVHVLAASSIHQSADLNVPFRIDDADTNALYFVLVAKGAPTLAANGDLSCTVYIEQETA